MFSHAIPCQGGVTRAEREREREGERGVFLEGGAGGGRWRASWCVGVAVTTLVTKAMKAEGGCGGLSKAGVVWIGCM